MYFKELNDKRVSQLKEFITGKSVIIVGNSISLLDKEYGDLIDSYDVVVRIGKGVPSDSSMDKNIGKKIDVWFTGLFRSGIFNRVKCKWKVITLSCLSLYADDYYMPITRPIVKGQFVPYRHFFIADSVDNTKRVFEGYGFSKDARPSQGVICVDFFSRILRHNDITIIGFDYFKSSKIIDEVEYTSWHMPHKVTDIKPPAHSINLEKTTMNKLIKKYGVKVIKN